MQIARSLCVSDAVAQLAARGVISGYPDGTYKGAKPTTRYEMASALARALAVIDMEKASKQDVEMLKRLVVEFKDELDALGVKVDSIDSRLAVMEKDLGGWRIYGQFRFDAKWGNNAGDHGSDGKTDFELSRYRIFLTKRINETTTFTTRIGAASERSGMNNAMRFERYFVTTKLPYDITLTVGKQSVDYEGDLGLYHDWGDAAYNYGPFNGVRLQKDWGKANFDIFVSRLNDSAGEKPGVPYEDEVEIIEGTPHVIRKYKALNPWGNLETYFAGLKFTYDFNEKFQFALRAYYRGSNGDEMKYTLADGKTISEEYNVSAWSIIPNISYRFDNGIALRAFYGYQKLGSYYENNADVKSDKATEWGVLLDVPQSVLKFTRIRADYRSFDSFYNYYQTRKNPGDIYGQGTNILNKYVPFKDTRSKVWSIRLDQQWSDKWSTFAHYVSLNTDEAGKDDVKQWGIGAQYQLNPAMYFQLMYDSVDAGNRATDKDNVVRFRTFVSF